MTYRLLLDENIERPLLHALRDLGHDVEHVGDASQLDKGTRDSELATYATRENRLLVTYDTDFVHDVPESAHAGVLFVRRDTAPSAEIAEAVDRMAGYYPQQEVTGVEYVDNWFSSDH